MFGLPSSQLDIGDGSARDQPADQLKDVASQLPSLPCQLIRTMQQAHLFLLQAASGNRWLWHPLLLTTLLCLALAQWSWLAITIGTSGLCLMFLRIPRMWLLLWHQGRQHQQCVVFAYSLLLSSGLGTPALIHAVALQFCSYS
jgi:hypothetical protein